MAKTFGKVGGRKQFGTLTEFAEALQQPIKTVSNWTRHRAWKWSSRPPWRPEILPDVLRWAAESLQQGRPRSSPAGSESPEVPNLRKQKLEQEIRKLHAQADQAETALARERGKLFDANEVQREWTNIGAVVRNAFSNLTSQVVPLALSNGMPHEASSTFSSQVEEAINGILRHLSSDTDEEHEDGTESILREPVSA